MIGGSVIPGKQHSWFPSNMAVGDVYKEASNSEHISKHSFWGSSVFSEHECLNCRIIMVFVNTDTHFPF